MNRDDASVKSMKYLFLLVVSFSLLLKICSQLFRCFCANLTSFVFRSIPVVKVAIGVLPGFGSTSLYYELHAKAIYPVS